MIVYILFLLLVLGLFSVSIGKNNVGLPGNTSSLINSYTYPFEGGAWFFVIVFSGLRYGVGTDYFSYEDIYNSINVNSEYNDTLEYGFKYLTSFFYNSGIDFYSYVIFLSLLTNSIFLMGLKYWYKDSLPSQRFLYFLFFFISSTYFWPFNGIRQGIACAFCLISFKFIEKRNFIKFSLCVLCAFLFHKSALILFPFYFLFKIRFSKLLLALGVILAILLHFLNGIEKLGQFILPYLGDKYARYIYMPPDFGGSGMGVYIYVFIFFFISISFYYILDEKKKNDKINFLFLLYTLGVILRVLALDNIIFVRLAYYFTTFDMVFIPYFIFLMDGKFNRVVLSLLFVFLYSVLFSGAILYSNGLVPYDSILSK